jgi:tryptophan synthase alpha subunit
VLDLAGHPVHSVVAELGGFVAETIAVPVKAEITVDLPVPASWSLKREAAATATEIGLITVITPHVTNGSGR